jgi:hypothetical protein
VDTCLQKINFRSGFEVAVTTVSADRRCLTRIILDGCVPIPQSLISRTTSVNTWIPRTSAHDVYITFFVELLALMA